MRVQLRILAAAFLAVPLCAHAVLRPLPRLPADAVAFDTSPTTLTQPQSALAIAVPGDRRITFATQTVQPAGGMTGIHGRSSAGDHLSLFVAGNRILGGDIYATGGRYRLARFEDRSYWVRHRDYPAERSVGDFAGLDVAPSPVAAGSLAAPPTAEPAADGKYEIDVLILYTRLIEERFGGPAGVAEEAQRLLFVANTFFDNSLIPARYRLVGTERYDGTDEESGYYANRDTIAADPAVRALRDRAGADLVQLYRTMDGNGDLCGLASGFNGLKRGGDPPDNVDPERDAFSVVGASPSADGALACSDNVPAHELGHELAGGHAYLPLQEVLVLTGGVAPYWRSYSHGILCGDAGNGERYQSIMAALPYVYMAGIVGGDFFSNPDLVLDGQVCGSAGIPGIEATQANNARAITEAAPYVAAYRGAPAQKQATPPSGFGGAGSLLGGIALLVMAALRRRITPA